MTTNYYLFAKQECISLYLGEKTINNGFSGICLFGKLYGCHLSPKYMKVLIKRFIEKHGHGKGDIVVVTGYELFDSEKYVGLKKHIDEVEYDGQYPIEDYLPEIKNKKVVKEIINYNYPTVLNKIKFLLIRIKNIVNF